MTAKRKGRKAKFSVLTLMMLFFLIGGIIRIIPGMSREKEAVSFTLKKLSITNSLDRFYDVTMIGKKIWICGHFGTILYSVDGGETWEKQETGISNPLLGIANVDEKRLWAVGGEGTIIHTRDGGETWKRMKSEVKEQLFQVTFLNENKGWVVGAYSTLLVTENGGRTWKNVSLDLSVQEDPDEFHVTHMFNDIFFWDEFTGWIVGEEGVVLHTNDGGINWTLQNYGMQGKPYLTSIKFRTPEEGIAVGEQGLCFLTQDGGRHWAKLPTYTTSPLYDTDFIDDHYLVVGACGEALILETTGERTTVNPLFPTEMRRSNWIPTSWLSAIKASSAGDIVCCGRGLILVKQSSSTWSLFTPSN